MPDLHKILANKIVPMIFELTHQKIDNSPENFERWRTMPYLSLLTTLLVSQKQLTPQRMGQLMQHIKPILARPPARTGHSMEAFKNESKQIWQDKSLSATKRKAKISQLEKIYKSGALNHLTSEPGISSVIPATMLRNLTYGYLTSRESIYRNLDSPFEVLLVMNLIRVGPFKGGSH